MGIALLIVLLALLVAALPRGSRRGYGTSAALGLAAVALLLAMIFDYVPWTTWEWGAHRP
jgi:hypothetical protein